MYNTPLHRPNNTQSKYFDKPCYIKSLCFHCLFNNKVQQTINSYTNDNPIGMDINNNKSKDSIFNNPLVIDKYSSTATSKVIIKNNNNNKDGKTRSKSNTFNNKVPQVINSYTKDNPIRIDKYSSNTCSKVTIKNNNNNKACESIGNSNTFNNKVQQDINSYTKDNLLGVDMNNNNKSKDNVFNISFVIDKLSSTTTSKVIIKKNNNNKAGETVSNSNTFNIKVQQEINNYTKNNPIGVDMNNNNNNSKDNTFHNPLVIDKYSSNATSRVIIKENNNKKGE